MEYALVAGATKITGYEDLIGLVGLFGVLAALLAWPTFDWVMQRRFRRSERRRSESGAIRLPMVVGALVALLVVGTAGAAFAGNAALHPVNSSADSFYGEGVYVRLLPQQTTSRSGTAEIPVPVLSEGSTPAEGSLCFTLFDFNAPAPTEPFDPSYSQVGQVCESDPAPLVVSLLGSHPYTLVIEATGGYADDSRSADYGSVLSQLQDPTAPPHDECPGVEGDQPEGTVCDPGAAPDGTADHPLVADPSLGWGRFQMASSAITVLLLAVLTLRSFGTRSAE